MTLTAIFANVFVASLIDKQEKILIPTYKLGETVPSLLIFANFVPKNLAYCYLHPNRPNFSDKKELLAKLS